MRIAIFSEVYWPMVSGVSLVLQRLAGALEQRGHAVRVYAPDYPLPDGTSDPRNIHRVPSRRLFLYPEVRWGFPSWPVISSDFAAFRPDLVHVATEFAMGTVGIRLARESGIPVVASAHTDYERYSSRYRLDWLMPSGWHYLRWFYGNAARVLCPSRQYQRHLNLRGIRHTGIWSRGVDAELFDPARRSAAVRAELGVDMNETMVLYVGRLAAEKGLHLLLEAWRQLEGWRGKARLVLVGSGPLEETIRNDMPPSVMLPGTRTGSELAAIYASADIFAFPSSTETFGNVLLEAMASGLPSLAVGAGGVLDFAEHDVNAWLAEPDSVESLAEGLAMLLADPPMRERLSLAARATALARDWESIFDGVVREYRQVCTQTEVELAA